MTVKIDLLCKKCGRVMGVCKSRLVVPYDYVIFCKCGHREKHTVDLHTVPNFYIGDKKVYIYECS